MQVFISKIVICAFPERITVGYWRMGNLIRYTQFEKNTQGQEAFGTWLTQHINIPIYIMTDSAEEDYRFEPLPHTTGSTRKNLVDRKLNQYFRNLMYRAAQFTGRSQDKRKDDQFLLVGLNQPEILEPWMSIIEALEAPLAGVYLMATVSQFIYQKLKLNAQHLLLSIPYTSGLRQTYFHAGKMRVSRLIPNVNVSEKNLGTFYANEAEKARLYLVSLRLIERETALSVVLPNLGELTDLLSKEIRSNDTFKVDRVDVSGYIAQGGNWSNAAEINPELLAMHTLAGGGFPANLAPPSKLRNYLILKLRNYLQIASYAVILVASALSTINLWELHQNNQEQNLAIAQTKTLEAQYRQISSNFPSTPIPGDQLKIAVDAAKSIQNQMQTPQTLMFVTSKALSTSPDVILKRLHWILTDDLNASDDPKATPPNKNSGAAGQDLRQIGFIDGEIKNFTGDYRAALDVVNHLTETLKLDPSVDQVTVIQQPVNVSSLSNLQGSTLDAKDQQIPAAKFKVRVLLKLTPKTSGTKS